MNRSNFVFGWISGKSLGRGSSKDGVLDPGFLRSITATTVPTPAEEQKLGKIIQTAIRRILKIPKGKPIATDQFPSKEELISKMRARERAAVEELVIRNLRMAILIARRYSGSQMGLNDLVGYGIEGLYYAALRFDYARKVKFCTYATWWVRHYIQRSSNDHGYTVRTPVHEFDRRRAIYKARNKLEQKLGREPTLAELATKLRIPKKRIEGILAHTVRMVSINASLPGDGEYGSRELGDMLANSPEIVCSPDQEVELNLDSEKLKRAMEVLDPCELVVLKLRFHEDLTLKESAEHPELRALQKEGRVLSRERARQLQEQALSKLRTVLSDGESDFHGEKTYF